DFESGEEVIFGDELTLDDIIWVGAGSTIAEQARAAGVKSSLPMSKLAEFLNKAKSQGRKIHFTPPYRSVSKQKLSTLLGVSPDAGAEAASLEMIRGIVALRSIKEAQEIIEIEKSVNTTADMHISAMRAARKGMLESEVAAVAHGISVAANGTPSFPIICSTDGQTLHNHYHGNKLASGKLLLLDCGAEGPSHYAGDMTRTFPVDAKFTQKQREVYQIVLDSQVAAAEALKPGVPYRDIHLLSAMVITEGLKSLGLMKGNTEEAVAAGAHALFFPHGLGHMMGLDVHDMEDLGENHVGYSETITRSSLFGTAYLRLGRELEPGFVLTVEPGIYFIPELIDLWSGEKKHAAF
ncbi:MAG: M24 family metallopeptidase, partial [Methylococcales bacterium]|nr:M24 family metallopeptidase [Methylococcales bacterium]